MKHKNHLLIEEEDTKLVLK